MTEMSKRARSWNAERYIEIPLVPVASYPKTNIRKSILEKSFC